MPAVKGKQKADDDDEFDQLDGDEEYVEDPEEEDVDPNVFKIRGQLNEPRRIDRILQDLHGEIQEDVIDLNAPYQRDVVWDNNKQIGLINSLFRNFHIPPLVFAVRRNKNGEVTKTCVDGKQRLTSIRRFFTGEIFHRDHITKKLWYYSLPPSKKKSASQLPEWAMKEFANKRIPVVEYIGIPEGMERAIFQRVQLGVPLTVPEKLRAIESPWSNWISTLNASYIETTDGLDAFLKFDISRGRAYQNLGYLVMVCYFREQFVSPTAALLTKFLEHNEHNERPPQAFVSEISTVLGTFLQIASSEKFKWCFPSRKLAPIEFVYVGRLLFRMMGADSIRLAKAINELTTFMAARHPGAIRMNTRVARTAFDFIEEQLSSKANQDLFQEGKKRKREIGHPDGDYADGPILGNTSRKVKTKKKKD